MHHQKLPTTLIVLPARCFFFFFVYRIDSYLLRVGVRWYLITLLLLENESVGAERRRLEDLGTPFWSFSPPPPPHLLFVEAAGLRRR